MSQQAEAPVRKNRTLRETAETLAAKQKDISVSEFFAKNRHLLGFDNPRKALLTTVKEAVDNSLDACEEAGILADITCDSDGKVSKFVDLQDVRDTLPLHKLKVGEPYYIGFFLMGAYQDIMGDLHNLFGRVNEAHVFLDEDEESGWYIEETIEGSTIAEVLSMTQWDKNELTRQVKAQVDAAIKGDRLKPNEAMKLLANYERGLKGYTYLHLNGGNTKT